MIDTFYSSRYGADTELLSMRKLPLIAERVAQEGLVNLIEPKGVHSVTNRLKQLHNPVYVEAFLKGEGKLAVSNQIAWTEEVRNGVLESVAGTLEASQLVLDSSERAGLAGVSASISQGFHHAEYDEGGGYCTFNALALVAQELPERKIFVLDCDEHQGNGTKEFTARLPNLYNFSIFGSYMGQPDTLPRAWDRWVVGWDSYEAALMEGFTTIMQVQPDLVLYQAGVDCYKNDGMSKAGLRSSELYERDRQVFEFCRDMSIPVTFVMAGGYGEHAIFHHVQTFGVAVEVFSQPQSSSAVA